ncbi:MAG: FRG domain-containing protein, partial [Acetobacter papayae]
RIKQNEKIIKTQRSFIYSEMLFMLSFSERLGDINLSDVRSKNLNDSMNRIMKNSDQKELEDLWPTEEALEFMALCQHSGVPTRLLDWSYNPYVAAHFAAYSSIINNSTTDKLAVWRYNTENTINARVNEQKGDPVTEIYRLEPPFWGSNPNAVAQSGCFLFLRKTGNKEYNNLEPHVIVDIDKSKTPLVKITTPQSEAPKILNFCSLMGITRSKLFRTYEGCAEHIKTQYEEMIEFAIKQ